MLQELSRSCPLLGLPNQRATHEIGKIVCVSTLITHARQIF